MLYQKFELDKKYPEASLTAYVCDKTPKSEPRPAIIVCPGGGYESLSEREGEPIVKHFFANGFNAYLLKYGIGVGARDYAPLIQASLAIKLVRERAELDNTNPEKIYIIGFSAGGHLAASTGTLWNIPEVRDAIGVTDGLCPEGINRPNGMMLCYPVIVGGEFANKGSIQRVCGNDTPSAEDIEKYSLERHVDASTPPAFIWHTFADTVVPIQNSLLFMDALTRAGVPFEAHIFPEGVHGLSLAKEETAEGKGKYILPHVQCWADLAVKWVMDC